MDRDPARRYRAAPNFRRLGLEPPFPWTGLWDWYGFYSQNLATYRERRDHIRELTRVALEQLDQIEARGGVHDPAADDDTPTWENLNGRISGLVNEYSAARDRDDWQDVGRRSREILIDFGKLIADPAIVPEGQDAPKGADAKAWFDLFLAAYASGRDKSELRATMRAVWDLAQKVNWPGLSSDLYTRMELRCQANMTLNFASAHFGCSPKPAPSTSR